jgi:hypothetical protein
MSVLTIFSPRTISLNCRTANMDRVATLSIFFIRAFVCTSNRHLVFWWRASEYCGGALGFLLLLLHKFFRPACGSTTILSTKIRSQFHQQWSLQINQRPKRCSRPGGKIGVMERDDPSQQGRRTDFGACLKRDKLAKSLHETGLQRPCHLIVATRYVYCFVKGAGAMYQKVSTYLL